MSDQKNIRSTLNDLWWAMKKRCTDPSHDGYKNYGAKGIKVCNRWSNFETFFTDMAPGYKAGLQLTRIDKTGDYTPENCQWLAQTINLWQRGPTTKAISSKYIGVGWNKLQQEWTANIRENGKRIYIGKFKTEMEAAQAYDSRCIQLRGDNASLNSVFFKEDFQQTA